MAIGTIDLHVDSARITGSCTSSRVTLVVPVDLHNLCVNEIKNFERTQQSKSLLLSELLTEQLHL